jgi:hypothetical protein
MPGDHTQITPRSVDVADKPSDILVLSAQQGIALLCGGKSMHPWVARPVRSPGYKTAKRRERKRKRSTVGGGMQTDM